MLFVIYFTIQKKKSLFLPSYLFSTFRNIYKYLKTFIFMEDKKKIVKRVLKNISNGQLYIVIDKKSNIKKDDYVKIEVIN